MASTTIRESSFCDKDQKDTIVGALYDQKQSATFCDVIMRVCGQEIYAHSNLLAASSPYFNNFLRQDLPRQFSQRNPQVIEIQIDGSEPNVLYEEAVSTVIDFIYTGKMNVKEVNVAQILEIARIMQMDSVVRFCEDFSQGLVPAEGYILHRSNLVDEADGHVIQDAAVTADTGVNTDIVGNVAQLASWGDLFTQKPIVGRSRLKPCDLAFAAKVKAKQLVSISSQVYPHMLPCPDRNDRRDMHDQATSTDIRYFDAIHKMSVKSKRPGRKKQIISQEVDVTEKVVEQLLIEMQNDNLEEDKSVGGEEVDLVQEPERSTVTEEILTLEEEPAVQVPESEVTKQLPSIEKPVTRSQRVGVKRSSALELLHGSNKRRRSGSPLKRSGRHRSGDITQTKKIMLNKKVKEEKVNRDSQSGIQEENSDKVVKGGVIAQEDSTYVNTGDDRQPEDEEMQESTGVEVDEQIEEGGSCGEEYINEEELSLGDKGDQEEFSPKPKGKRRGTKALSDKRSNVGPGKYQCDTCFFITNKVREMSAHIKLHKVEKNTCYYCEQTLQNKEELMQHMEKHKGPDPFFCHSCGIRFKSRTLLNMHMPKHSDNKPYICEVCCMGFKWKHALKCHMLTHSNKKEHLCDLCGYATNHKSQLKAHRKIHTGDTFRCTIPGCQFQATKLQNMKYHMLTHTREKPHQCDICGQNFSLVKNLRRHMLLHTTKKKKVPTATLR